MLETIKDFIPDLIILDHYKQPSLFMKGTTEYLIIQIEGYQYEISSKLHYERNLNRRFYSYVFGNDEGEFYKYLYHGTNFNELINAIKEEMKRRKENDK